MVTTQPCSTRYNKYIHNTRHMTTIQLSATPKTKKQIQETQLQIAQNVQDLCKTLEENHEQYVIELHERSILRDGDSGGYHKGQLREIHDGTANLNRFVSYEGRKYIKIVMQEYQEYNEYYPNREVGYRDGSVHAFVDKKTGDVYKPAGYNKPAKHVRYNLMNWDHRKFLLNPKCVDWAGGYLYMR